MIWLHTTEQLGIIYIYKDRLQLRSHKIRSHQTWLCSVLSFSKWHRFAGHACTAALLFLKPIAKNPRHSLLQRSPISYTRFRIIDFTGTHRSYLPQVHHYLTYRVYSVNHSLFCIAFPLLRFGWTGRLSPFSALFSSPPWENWRTRIL